MDLRDAVDLLAELRRRVEDAETIVGSLRLSDVRLTVSANCRRDDSEGVRPRILPAFKTSSPLRHSRRSSRSTANPAASRGSRVTSSCDDVITPPTSISDVDDDVVKSAVVVCPGYRDVQQRAVILASCQHHHQQEESSDVSVWSGERAVHQLSRLLLYHCVTCCTPAHSVRSGVTLIVDCRRSSLTTLRSLVRLLTIVQSSLDGEVCPLQSMHVFALSDDDSRQALLQATNTVATELATSSSSSTVLQPSFEIVSSVDELYEYVARDSLPSSLGGPIDFSQSAWLSYQQRLESFVTDCSSTSSQLLSSVDEVVSLKELPSTVLEARSLLSRHEQYVASVLRLPTVSRLCSTQQHGDAELNQLSTDLQQFGHNAVVFREWLEWASQLYRQVREAYDRLSRAAEDRATKLERCLQLRQFEDKASTVINWLCTEAEDHLRVHSTAANNLRSIEAQQLEFAKFQSVAKTYVESSEAMMDEVTMLTQFGVCDETTGLAEVKRELQSRAKSFVERLKNVELILDLSQQCYQLLDTLYEWAVESMRCVRAVNMDRRRTPSDVAATLYRVQQFVDSNPSPLTSQVDRQMDSVMTAINNPELRLTWSTARQRCVETDTEVQRCLSALRRAADVVPDTRKCRRASDVPAHSVHPQTTQPIQDVSQPNESAQSTTNIKKSDSFPSQKNADNFDVRDYLIDRCVTDTNPAAAADTDEADNSDEIDGVDKPDENSSTELLRRLREPCERSSKPPPPPTLPSQRFSDTDLVRQTVAATLPGRASSTSSAAESRAKRHRWKLLRKALNLLLVDESTPAGDADAGNNAAGDEDERAAGQGEEEESHRLGVFSISVESLPGLGECTENADVTEVGAADTHELMTCRKYSWTGGDSTQLCYDDKQQTIDDDQQQQQQERVDEGEDDATSEDEDQRRQNRVLSLVMQELLQTEKDYIRALNYIVDNYIPEILLETVPQPLRGKKNVVFGNLQNICKFHTEVFLREIEACIESPFQLGACFLRHESGFYLYALYNKNKPKSDELMIECGSTYFRAKQLQLNDRMDLSSYLLKPVQRMGKYALLLSQVSKECPQTHPDYGDLKAALEMVRFQLRHGNNLLAMDCLRSCDVNLHEQGLLLRQTEFVVSYGRKRSLRHVFLFEELVIFSKTHHSPTGHDVYVYKHSVKMTDVGLTETVGDSGDTFELWYRKRTPSTTFVLQASSAQVCADWVRDVSSLLWKQTLRNRRRQQAELACLGVNDRSSFDLTPSKHNIYDRFVDVSLSNNPVRLRASMMSRDRQRNDNKRPHSLVSVSSSSSSGSSGFAGALTGFHGHAAGGPGVPAAQLGTLTTMHESPLELVSTSGPEHVENDGTTSAPVDVVDQSSSAAADDEEDSDDEDPLMLDETITSHSDQPQQQLQDAFSQTTAPHDD